MGKKVLMACTNHYHSALQVGSHHIARAFLRNGWQVAHIGDPISPFHILKGITPQLRNRFLNWTHGGIVEEDGNLWSYVPFGMLTPGSQFLLNLPIVLENWMNLSIPNVMGIISKHGFSDVDIIYFDSVFHAHLLDKISYKRSLYRIADNLAGFNKCTSAMIAKEKEIAQRVDIVAYTSDNLKDRALSLKPKKILKLSNGVDYHHFADGSYAHPPEFASIPKPIAIYIGSLDQWFDFDLIDKASSLLPKVSFVLIGPDNLAKRRLTPKKNLYLIGSRPFASLPQYLHNSDVGIITFNRRDYKQLIDSINPLKLYEYMACGLPVISTLWPAIEELKSPAHLYTSNDVEEFVKIIQNILIKPKDRQFLLNYSRQYDWAKITNRLIDGILL